MPTSGRGSDAAGRAGAVAHGKRPRGLTQIELLVVIALVALGTGVVALALRDRGAGRLEEEGARLAALLEGARAEARAAGLAVLWVPSANRAAGAEQDAFRFVGLPERLQPARRWLDARTSAQVVGAPALQLGPDAILPPQRVTLSLDEHRIDVGTDGLGPFAVLPAVASDPAR
ncbi:MAG: type II secretion system protein GspH [Pseudomonadota bacterium]